MAFKKPREVFVSGQIHEPIRGQMMVNLDDAEEAIRKAEIAAVEKTLKKIIDLWKTPISTNLFFQMLQELTPEAILGDE